MHQYSQGKFTTQGHKGIPDGHFEEEQGRSGFFGPVSHLIKEKPSTRWSKIEGPLKPRLLDVINMEKNWNNWQRLFYNADVVIYFSWMKKTTTDLEVAHRNADGDTLYFCHFGSGIFVTEYGSLEFKKGSYIQIPKCVTHSLLLKEDSSFLIIENRTSQFREPDRGMLGRNGFYDLAAIGKPSLDQQSQLQISKIKAVHVKRSDELTIFTYPDPVFDTVGWKGDFFPYTLHVDDLMPIVSARVHLPPSVHSTFIASGFVVCTFLPRPLETDVDALKVPFYHQNIDYDEILFYHDGNFFSRDNLHAGMISFHPAGFPHGPHPKAVKNVSNKTHTDEYAVMIDTKGHLLMDDRMAKVEVADYWNSWNK